MKRTLQSSVLAAGLALAVGLFCTTAPRAQQAPPTQVVNAVEIQTRGPVHEAYAQPIENQTEPPPVVDKQPPPPVPEEVPQDRPEGADVQWIDGYWAWDAERNDYLWVTGTFRNMPPGMRYVAGYWEQTPNGWRWVPGFYVPDSTAQLPYVPEPPAPLDTGPVGQPPNDNSFWVPGNWAYQQQQYVWQPGFWSACRPGLVWVPNRYLWTPAGCLFVRGFWDRDPYSRGFLYAPVAFHRPLWQTPGYRYNPTYVVSTGALYDSLFVRPRWNHYYFGNYYGANYARAGYQPWPAYAANRYDPLFSYARWQNRTNPQWATAVQQTYVARAAGRAPTPPLTFHQQTALLNAHAGKTTVNQTVINNTYRVVTPVTNLSHQNVTVHRVTPTQLATHQAEAQRLRDLGAVRRQQELAAAKVAAVNPNQAAARSLNLAAAHANAHLPNNVNVVQPRVNNVLPNVNHVPTPKTGVQNFTLPRVNNVVPGNAQPRVTTVAPPGTLPRINNVTPHVTNAAPHITNVQPRVTNVLPPSTLPRITNVAPHVTNVQPRATTVAPPSTLPRINNVTPRTPVHINSAPVIRSAPAVRAPAVHAPAVHHAPVSHGGGKHK